MSLDERLRQGLEGLDALEGAPSNAVVDVVLGRGRRSRWTRRLLASAVVLVVAIGGLVVGPRVVDALANANDPRPAVPKGEAGVITTVVGTGAHYSSGDGGLATDAEINLPSVIGFDAKGNLYINDGEGEVRVRKIDRAGVITTVIGPPAVFGDAEPVGKLANLRILQGRAVDAAGNLYVVSDRGLLKVTPGGRVTLVAGKGHAGCSGDGGPAREAHLNMSYAGVTVDPEGNIYITQYHDDCVRKVDTNGVITTIAGTGQPGFSGDGGPAVEAELHGPTTVSLDGEGNIYISDLENHRIRRVDPSGIITTVAGNGEEGFPQDGAVATEVAIGGAEVFADPDGTLYITDEGHPGIFQVDPDGILTIIAGTGADGYAGDGGPATEAQLSEPTTVAIGPDGDLYIADWGNCLIRKVNL